jgi:hypothetical protein
MIQVRLHAQLLGLQLYFSSCYNGTTFEMHQLSEPLSVCSLAFLPYSFPFAVQRWFLELEVALL